MSFTQSDKTKKHEEDYYAHLNNAPGEFSSEYTPKKETALNDYLNRKPFEYNADTDKSYNIYKRNYETAGKKAMKDTIGQATALTGGYGSSYAETAGQQVYNQYMAELESQLPQFESAAFDRYNQEGNKLLNYYELLRSAESDDYNRYLDEKADYDAETARLKGLWDDSYNKDYTAYRDNVSDTQYAEQMAYQRERDAISDQRYADELAYQKEQDALNQAALDAEILAANKPTPAQYQKAIDAYQEGGEEGLVAYIDSARISEDYIEEMMEFAIEAYEAYEAPDYIGTDENGNTTWYINGETVTLGKGISPYGNGEHHKDTLNEGEYSSKLALKTKPWIPNNIGGDKLTNSKEKVKSRGVEYTVFDREGTNEQYVWVGKENKYYTLQDFKKKFGED